MKATRALAVLLTCSCAGAKQPAPASSAAGADAADRPKARAADASAAAKAPPSIDDELAQLHREEWRRFNQSAASFNVADGIDKAEAEFLGQAYFFWRLGACGAPDDAKDEGEEWRMPVRFGATGKYLPDPIRVAKPTGVVSYARGPSVEPGKLIDIERKRLQKDLRQPAEPRSGR